MKKTLQTTKHNRIIVLINFIIIMVALGMNDALKGIFAPIFEQHFHLSTAQLSVIVTVSYIGNLFFMLFGGRFVDKYKRKTISISVMLLWISSLILFLVTDNYYCLLIGMFLGLGASTLMNTTINIMIPAIFTTTPGLIVNIVYFTQGIGTSGSQKLIGNFANGFESWKYVNLFLLILGMISVILLLLTPMPEEKKEKKASDNKISYSEVVKNPAFIYLICIFGFYFIAEHGVLNWLITYSNKQLGFSISQSSTYLSIFFGGITVGRLIFAPVVQKLGVLKSIELYGVIGTALYIVGMLLGKNTIMLLSLSGFVLSIIYPTLVLLIRQFYEVKMIATATGTVISIATLFDIGFNAVFGKLVDSIGFSKSILILPISMLLFITSYLVFRKKVSPIHE